jgi:hypothetical protein
MAMIRERGFGWGYFDYGRFRTLASEVSPDTGHAASVIESAMRSLADDLAVIRSAEPSVGYDWNHFDWRIWNNSVVGARDALQIIVKELALEQ